MFAFQQSALLFLTDFGEWPDVCPRRCTVERVGVIFVMRAVRMQVLVHERPDKSEAPMFTFQQSAWLFFANFGERPDVCPGRCTVEQVGVIFMMRVVCIQVLVHERPDKSEAPMFTLQQSASLFFANFGERPDVGPGLCTVEQGRVIFVVRGVCGEALAHERPDKSEAPMFTFQQNALLFLTDFGERPNVCPGLCVIERDWVVFVVGAVRVVGCGRARVFDGARRPVLRGTPRSGSGRRHRA